MTKSESEIEFNLEDFLPYRLHQASEAISQSFRNIYRLEYGMTRSEWRVLAHLGQYGAMTASAIGAAANLHKTKVSRAIFTLEQRRWLKRRENPGDRRLKNVQLTPAGRKAYAKLEVQAHNYNVELAKKMGAEDFAKMLSLSHTLLRTVEGK